MSDAARPLSIKERIAAMKLEKSAKSEVDSRIVKSMPRNFNTKIEDKDKTKVKAKSQGTTEALVGGATPSLTGTPEIIEAKNGLKFGNSSNGAKKRFTLVSEAPP